LPYVVFVFDTHIKIGCELHSKEKWKNFGDKEILAMGGKKALKFWNENKEWLLRM